MKNKKMPKWYELPETDGFVCTDCHSDSEGNCIVLCPLHACAADMLLALKAALYQIKQHAKQSGSDYILKQCRAVIRKAEGGE